MEACSAVDPDQRQAQQLAAFLSLYRPIADGLVKEFFLDDHWEKRVPAAWRAPLEALPLSELAELLHRPAPSAPGTVWPLSLMAFVACAHSLRLPARGVAHDVPESAEEHDLAALAGLDVALSVDPAAVKPTADGRCPEEVEMGVDLRRAVKPKKMHEIVHLGALTDRVARAAACDLVVDVGSGQGYLSRALAFHYNWPVVAIEGIEDNVAAADRIDGKVQRGMAKRLRDERECVWQPGVGSLRHVAARLPPTATPQQLWAILGTGPAAAAPPAADAAAPPAADAAAPPAAAAAPPAVAAPPSPAAAPPPPAATPLPTAAVPPPAAAAPSAAAAPLLGGRSTLVGLHTCGDLACTMLRVFDSAAAAVGAVVSVGCCYMHLSEDAALGAVDLAGRGAEGAASVCAPCEGEAGYPMSAWVARLRVPMGFHVREMACHHLEAYAARLAAAAAGGGGEESLRGQCRRAALEVVLREHSGFAGRTCVGAFKNSAALSFGEYVGTALRRLGLPALGEEEARATLARCEPMLRQWRRVIVYYVLRLLLAPLWEALLLLDRLLFLRERGHRAQLLRLFDPTLSPRNYALVAMRR